MVQNEHVPNRTKKMVQNEHVPNCTPTAPKAPGMPLEGGGYAGRLTSAVSRRWCYAMAFRTISENESALSEAPPTRAPSTSGLATSSAILPGLAEPP